MRSASHSQSEPVTASHSQSEQTFARISAAWSVVPSDSVSHTMTEPYNAGLAASQLVENCNAVFCVDNEVSLLILQSRSRGFFVGTL